MDPSAFGAVGRPWDNRHWWSASRGAIHGGVRDVVSPAVREMSVSESADTFGVRHRPVSRLIRMRRLARGLTQAQAAEEAGVSVGAWRSTETGTRRPRPHTFAAILEALDLSPHDVHTAAPQPVELDSARHSLADLCLHELPDDAVVPLLDLVYLLAR